MRFFRIARFLCNYSCSRQLATPRRLSFGALRDYTAYFMVGVWDIVSFKECTKISFCFRWHWNRDWCQDYFVERKVFFEAGSFPIPTHYWAEIHWAPGSNPGGRARGSRCWPNKRLAGSLVEIKVDMQNGACSLQRVILVSPSMSPCPRVFCENHGSLSGAKYHLHPELRPPESRSILDHHYNVCSH